MLNRWSLKFDKCIDCETVKIEHKARGLCNKCYRESLRRKCDFCGKLNVIATRKNEKVVCQSCNKKYFCKPKKRECSMCKEVKRIDRLVEGQPICMTCNKKYFYKPPKDICYFCGEFKLRDGYKNKKPICNSCYKKNYYKRPKRICGNCGNLGYIEIIIDRKKFCRRCYKTIIKREYYLALEHIRRTKIKCNGGEISEKDFKEILNRDKICVYCGGKENLTFDHIIPVIKGGKSEISNYVLACLSCNISKGKKDVFEWCKWKKIKVPKIIIDLLKDNKTGDYGDSNPTLRLSANPHRPA